jgi:hypothetical protein
MRGTWGGAEDMAQDDYFVLAHKILKYLYACLKKGVSPDAAFFDADACGITKRYRDYIMVTLYEGGYISDALLVPPVLGNDEKSIRISGRTKITPAGIQYLDENSMFAKVKNFVKDVADIIP